MKIPKSLHKYFWDVDVKKLDPENKPYFIISRLLDKGDFKSAQWVIDNFGSQMIGETLRNYKDFSLQSASFWALIYKIPKEEIKCFQEPYRTTHKTLWLFN